MPYHMSSAPPSEGATCSPWPFEQPWGLHVCPTQCPRRPHCSGATCSSWPFGKPWGLSFFTDVLSASCLARADPHTTARALGSSPSCSPHSSQGPGESSSDERAGTLAVSLQAPLHRVQRGHVRVSLRCGLHAIVVPCLPSAAVSAVLLHSGPLEARLGGSLGPWPYPFVGPQDHTRHRSRAHVARTRCQRDSASYSSEGPGASSSTSGS